MKLFLIFLIIPSIALCETRTKLFTNADKPHELIKSSPSPKLFEKKSNIKSPTYKETGNLPAYFMMGTSISMEESPVILPTQKQNIRNPDILIGDLIKAEILESLIAFSDSKAPIRAMIRNGKLKGSILLGEATLEKNSKRILIDFKKVTTIHSNQTVCFIYGVSRETTLGYVHLFEQINRQVRAKELVKMKIDLIS